MDRSKPLATWTIVNLYYPSAEMNGRDGSFFDKMERLDQANIFIHIGPPKSGTSAIQYWLQENRNFLKKNGIYYPEHLVDKNGVSSGNVRRIFHRRVGKNKLRTIAGARNRLLEEMAANQCHALLLSSEAFFIQLPDVMDLFPEARLIAYVRFPLDVLESKYNQSVKRSSNTQCFEVPEHPSAQHLEMLDEHIERYGRKTFLLRPYMPSCYEGVDIVTDFLSVIGVQKRSRSPLSGLLFAIGLKKEPPQGGMPAVNRSYSFEAMEFKRWLNNFDLSLWQSRIDLFLQGYSDGTLDYSLLHPKAYDHLKTYFLQYTRSFVQKHRVKNGNAFLHAIEAKEQKPFKKQKLEIQEFQKIVEALRWHDALLVGYLSVLIESSNNPALTESPFAQAFGAEAKVAKRNYTQLHDKVAGVPELLGRLEKLDSRNNAGAFRELALFCEENGELSLAYRLMKEAQMIRPDGPLIEQKILEYEKRLDGYLQREKRNCE